MPSATNSSQMRIRNEKTILSLLNRQSMSRADIAKKTGLTKAAVTIITEELIKRGIVTEEKSDDKIGDASRIGRTPILLRLCEDSVYFIGVNIKRTGIHIGMCDICGMIIFEEALDISEPDTALAEICGAIQKNITVHRIPKEKIYGISVVTPGPVDAEKGVILNPPNFNKWHGVSVYERMKKHTDIPVILNNVSAAAAVAERYFGAAKNSESFMTLLVDEGIGSGILQGDKLFAGSCEMGHISVKYDGVRCECGNRGCLEKYASIPNILAGTRYKSWSECTKAQDMEIMSAEAEYLSAAIVTATNIFDLECTLLCGSLAENAEEFLSVVNEKTLEKMILKKDFKVLSGTVGSQILIPCAMGLYDFLH